MKARDLPAVERLRELFEISPESLAGLRRRVKVGRYLAGSPVGTDSGNGYWKCNVDGQQVHVHRIIYAMQYGSVSDGHLVTHINEDRFDNRIANLRITAYGQGTRTRRKRDTSTYLPDGIGKVGAYYRSQIHSSNGPLAKRGSLANVTVWLKQTQAELARQAVSG